MIQYLERVIWKILYPAMKEANLVRDCLPEPPTPTRRALPHGVRIIRDIWIDKQKKKNFCYDNVSCLFCIMNRHTCLDQMNHSVLEEHEVQVCSPDGVIIHWHVLTQLLVQKIQRWHLSQRRVWEMLNKFQSIKKLKKFNIIGYSPSRRFWELLNLHLRVLLLLVPERLWKMEKNDQRIHKLVN